MVTELSFNVTGDGTIFSTTEKCACGCAHLHDFGACEEFVPGMQAEHCVYCDHGAQCHPGTNWHCNGPLRARAMPFARWVRPASETFPGAEDIPAWQYVQALLNECLPLWQIAEECAGPGGAATAEDVFDGLLLFGTLHRMELRVLRLQLQPSRRRKA